MKNSMPKSKKLTGIDEVGLCLGHHFSELGFSRGAGVIEGRYYFTEFLFHPTRRWRFDYALPSLKIAVEVSGGVWMPVSGHRSGKGIMRDYAKSNEAQLLGWILLTFTPAQILKGEDLPMLRRAIILRTGYPTL